LVIDELAKKYEGTLAYVKKLGAEVGAIKVGRRAALLAKPQTYMNNSGTSVQAVLAFYKIPPERLILVHDDKDIPLGRYRLQTGRGAAGHNGVSSVMEHVGTKGFTRVRVGIAPLDRPIADTAAFVLAALSREERSILNETVLHATHEIERLVAA
jgi:PTH1 family peptidyl-tRNA hydrolase